MDIDGLASIFTDEILGDDASLRAQRRGAKILARAMRHAFNDGVKTGIVRTEYELAGIAGLTHGLSFLHGKMLRDAIQVLANSGTVRITVEGEKKQDPKLKLNGRAS